MAYTAKVSVTRWYAGPLLTAWPALDPLAVLVVDELLPQPDGPWRSGPRWWREGEDALSLEMRDSGVEEASTTPYGTPSTTPYGTPSTTPYGPDASVQWAMALTQLLFGLGGGGMDGGVSVEWVRFDGRALRVARTDRHPWQRECPACKGTGWSRQRDSHAFSWQPQYLHCPVCSTSAFVLLPPGTTLVTLADLHPVAVVEALHREAMAILIEKQRLEALVRQAVE